MDSQSVHDVSDNCILDKIVNFIIKTNVYIIYNGSVHIE